MPRRVATRPAASPSACPIRSRMDIPIPPTAVAFEQEPLAHPGGLLEDRGELHVADLCRVDRHRDVTLVDPGQVEQVALVAVARVQLGDARVERSTSRRIRAVWWRRWKAPSTAGPRYGPHGRPRCQPRRCGC